MVFSTGLKEGTFSDDKWLSKLVKQQNDRADRTLIALKCGKHEREKYQTEKMRG